MWFLIFFGFGVGLIVILVKILIFVCIVYIVDIYFFKSYVFIINIFVIRFGLYVYLDFFLLLVCFF